MKKYRFSLITTILFAGALTLLSGCSNRAAVQDSPKDSPLPTVAVSPQSATPAPTLAPSGSPDATKDSKGPKASSDGAVHVAAKPNDITVIVNKNFRLPDGYKPMDLVEPNVPFTFAGKLEKRTMRTEAAKALEKLFDAAKRDGVQLAGVSGYRSATTQEILFNSYAKKDGVQAANKYSAKPGFSEHQTGLAIDVAGISGKCAAEPCFADTKEAEWLAKHSAEYGFIIRYLKGKESITGYQYEPWHIRYVGVSIAKEIADKGITLEEYLGDAIPVSN